MMTILVTIMVMSLSLNAATALNAIGSQPFSASTVLQTPHYAGPQQPLSAGHPSFPWAPSSQYPTLVCKKVQYDFPRGTNANTSRADAVRGLYERSWAQYAERCFGQSTMLVVSDSCLNDLYGWGATIVDGLDTAIVMNLTAIVTKQLAFIATVDLTYV
jgi:mannosyl-oligosaccharide alpha-1,2-mannosidase